MVIVAAVILILILTLRVDDTYVFADKAMDFFVYDDVYEKGWIGGVGKKKNRSRPIQKRVREHVSESIEVQNEREKNLQIEIDVHVLLDKHLPRRHVFVEWYPW